MTLRARHLVSVLLAGVSMREQGLGETAGEVLPQLPHEVTNLRQSWFRPGQTCFQVIEPLVKSGVEGLTQALPLFSCTNGR